LCWLAAGRVDAFYEAELNDWDWAAGRVIAEEAGAQVTMLAGSVLLAATPELFGPLADLLDKARQTAGLSR
jgi:myo-inositol-1(or 4)-monophosphatase